MLRILEQFSIPEGEIHFASIRAQGPGGQHVNKVSAAIHLSFDIRASSLPAADKQRLLEFPDRRISKSGIIVIKAQRHRSREKNKEDALQRLGTLVQRALIGRARRIPTRPTKNSGIRRLDAKTRHGRLKALRRTVTD